MVLTFLFGWIGEDGIERTERVDWQRTTGEDGDRESGRVDECLCGQ